MSVFKKSSFRRFHTPRANKTVIEVSFTSVGSTLEGENGSDDYEREAEEAERTAAEQQ